MSALDSDLGALLGALRETQDRCAERNATFENLGHEMRTPLNGIVGTVDLLAQSELDPAQTELVAIIAQSAERLISAVDLLAEGASLNVRLKSLIADAQTAMNALHTANNDADTAGAPPLTQAAPAPAPVTPAPQPVASSTASESATETDTETGGTLRVLVAEDNTTNQLVVRSLLDRMGHTCTVVENGQLAVDAVQASPFDVILMDCMMPVLDGFGATRAIRELEASCSDIPILALTANALKGDRERCLDAGMTEYMAKPVRLDVLTDMLARFATRRPD